MRDIHKAGDRKIFTRLVTSSDTARFDSGEVHPVYATFALARDAEWVCRLFVLDMKENDEEGIGTMVTVDHLSPAFIDDEVVFEGVVEEITGNEIICSYTARVGERIIAKGMQGQKILKKERINNIFNQLRSGNG